MSGRIVPLCAFKSLYGGSGNYDRPVSESRLRTGPLARPWRLLSVHAGRVLVIGRCQSAYEQRCVALREVVARQ